MKSKIKALFVASGLCLSACAGVPAIPAIPVLGPVSTDVSATSGGESETSSVATEPTDGKPAFSVARAAELLASGKEAEARAILQAVLAASPRDSAAQHFMRQIETDPVKLLGPPSPDTYIVQPGDTMSGLADRFLGDSRMFYALGRYNGLAAANTLSVGRSLQLPASARRSATSASTPKDSPGPKAPVRKANDIRLEALQLLNKGEIDKAVELLKQAVSIDANDTTLRKDLERAERIQDSLRKG